MNFSNLTTRPLSSLKRSSAHLFAGVLMIVALGMVCSEARAHDANVATIKITKLPSDTWVFELHTPLYRLDEAVREANQERAAELADLDPDSVAYKELVIDYVKSVFDLEQSASADDTDVKHGSPSGSVLGRGRIKLDEHESILMFEIKNMPEELAELTLHLPYMKNSSGQANVLWLVDGKRSQSYVLTEGNQFTVSDVDFFENNDLAAAQQ